MRSDSQPDGQKPRSFIEEARRAQIIDSAIEALAEHGYAGASLAKIAARAGISKGVISYHFAGKEELIEQVVAQVYGRIIGFVGPRVEREHTATGRLGARIRAIAEYTRTHRAEMTALTEVYHNLRDAHGRLQYGDVHNEPLYQMQEDQFRAGQATGELRTFDPRVMAVTVQAAIEAMISYSDTYPDHDIEAHADELVRLFAAAITTPSPASPQST